VEEGWSDGGGGGFSKVTAQISTPRVTNRLLNNWGVYRVILSYPVAMSATLYVCSVASAAGSRPRCTPSNCTVA